MRVINSEMILSRFAFISVSMVFLIFSQTFRAPPILPKNPGIQRISNAALPNTALVLSSKNWKNIQDGGQRRKTNPKSLGLSAAVREQMPL